MMIIGSATLPSTFFNRTPKDLDLIATFDELNQLTKELRKATPTGILSIPQSKNKTILLDKSGRRLPIEVEIAWPGSTAEQLLTDPRARRYYESPHPDGPHHPVRFSQHSIQMIRNALAPTLDVLYTLKMSHRYLKDSVHFQKTMDDIKVLRTHGAKIWDEDWLKRREVETYTYEHPNLNTSKNAFFGKSGRVKYIYDHDSIHVAMSHLTKSDRPTPAYEFYKGDSAEVMCSKEKFFSVPEYVRLHGVLEEAYVLALERSQIPYGDIHLSPMDMRIFPYDQGISALRRLHNIKRVEEPPAPEWSFQTALKKVCSSITSGWFREYAWEHHGVVMSMYDPKYVKRFWDKVKEGVVKLSEESTALLDDQIKQHQWAGISIRE